MYQKLFAHLMGAVLAFAAISTVSAQDYPNKPIKLVVPFAPGGTTDLLARIVAEKLSRALGQSVVVDNRAGAGGVIGTEALARSAPDGYTIGMVTASTHGVNPAVYPKLSYDAITDFAPITRIASVPNVMAINANVAARNMKEFVALAQKQPGNFSFASPGSGSIGHAMGEVFKSSAKVDLVHIPYKGAGLALNDVIGGQVQVIFDNLPTSLPHIQGGKLRALAIASAKRSRNLPEVPTFAELGLEAVNEPAWFGIVAPAKTPEPILLKLHSAIESVMRAPDVMEKFDRVGATPMTESSAAFATHIRREIDTYKRVAVTAKIRVE